MTPTSAPDAPVTTSNRKRLILLGKLCVSLVIILLLFRHVDVREVGRLFARANGWLLAAGTGCVLLQTAISAWKWQVLLRAQRVAAPYWGLLRAYLIANFINLFMPGFFGGDAYRANWLRQHTGGFGTALPSIIIDRLSGLVALVVIASVGLGVLFTPAYPWVLGAMLLAAMVLGYVLAIGPIDRFLAWLPMPKLRGITTLCRAVIDGIRPRPGLMMVVVLSFVFQLNTVLINWLYSEATNLSVTLPQLLLIVPAVYLLEMLPISINGIGLREGAFTVLFAQMGLPPQEGLALGLTISLMRYVAGVVGGVLLADTMSGGRLRLGGSR